MDDRAKAQADNIIAAYTKVAPKWRKARIDACRLHASKAIHESHRAYWLYIADALAQVTE